MMNGGERTIPVNPAARCVSSCSAKSRRLINRFRKKRVLEVAVEKVLYGGGPKTVRFTKAFGFPDQRAIIALSREKGKVPFQFRYALDPEEVSSQDALARARLDYSALFSETVFLGQRLSSDGNDRHTVQIERSLHGPALAAAVVTGGRIFVDNSLRQWDPKTNSIVRIHETLSGKTLLAFPAPARWLRALRFSPDGKSLLVADEGALEVWPMPERRED